MSLLAVPNVFANGPGNVADALLVNANYNQVYNALNNTSTDRHLVTRFSGADPVQTLNQLGAGHIIEWQQGGSAKARINNTGQIQSTLTTGTAPLIIASTTKVDNLNADLLDGINGADFTTEAELATKKTAFSVSWFYPVLPAAVETVESVGRFLVPVGTEITITEIWAVWAGGADSGASNIFTIKRRNVSGTLQSDVGTIDINPPGANALVANNVSDALLAGADMIYPLFTTRNTGSEQLVTITVIGTQKLTT